VWIEHTTPPLPREAATCGIFVTYQRGGHFTARLNAQKTYAGRRAIDGLMVTADGRPLPEHCDVTRFTKWGWTHEATSPQQPALAILCDHLGDKERAIGLSEPFMRIADLDNDWALRSDAIDRAIEEIEGAG